MAEQRVPGRAVETESRRRRVIVVGAGPVGIAVACALAERRSDVAGVSDVADVVVVESGGDSPGQADPDLWTYAVGGDPRYGETTEKLRRAIGGTSWMWRNELPDHHHGVRYAALERCVLDGRDGPWGPAPAWPLGHADYDRLIERAGTFLGLERRLDADATHDRALPGLQRSEYAFGRREVARQRLAAAVDRGDVRVIRRATVVGLTPSASGVSEVEFVDAAGVRASIECDDVVLAAGTIENARLALALQRRLPRLATNRSIGVGLMDRPRVTGRLRLAGPPPAWFGSFAIHDDGTGPRMARVVAAPDGSPTASLMMIPVLHRPRIRGAVERRSRRWLIDSFDRRQDQVGPAAAHLVESSHPIRSRLHGVVHRTRYDLEWQNWGARPWARALEWQLTAIVEQFPRPENRIELTGADDRLGSPAARLSWGAPAERRGGIDHALSIIDRAFDADLGSVSWSDGFEAVSSHHMMGTLAFGDDETTSATTPDGLLRGTDNVYVAGMALFPSSGNANPTLTAVGLGLHVAERMSGVPVG